MYHTACPLGTGSADGWQLAQCHLLQGGHTSSSVVIFCKPSVEVYVLFCMWERQLIIQITAGASK